VSETVSFINLTDASLVSEDELLDRAREGDRSAFGTLYLRHRDAARKVAGMCASSAADAEDAVAEGFARVFAALPRMAGRQIAFRPYLLTCVRNAATDRLRRERRIDLREQMPETPGTTQADDMALLGLERNLVGEALQALPARWRTVLWLTEVEGLSPAEVSRRIGIKPNAVAALAYRARKGLREAYLQAHLKAEASEECRSTVGKLGNYVRGDLAEKERLAVQAHLDGCAKCRCRRDELTDVNATLRNAFLPVPLLLAGLQRRAFSFSHMATWVTPDVSQTAPLADNPLVHKALAGLTMVVLAFSGSAAPTVMHHSGPSSQVAQAADPSAVAASAGAASATGVPAGSATGARADVAAPAEVVAAAPAAAPATPAAPAPAADDPAAYRDLQGANHSTLLFSGRDGSPNYPGGTRSSIIHRTDGSGGGLLDGTPVGSALDSVVAAVSQAVPLPVDVGLSVPGVTGSLSAPLSATVQLPAGQSVSVQVPPVLSGVLGSVLQPVSGVLSGLGLAAPAGH
jgi:RNA polymerase sigma factor (sigma-70 family)